jgi:glycosyltransferase involved in cell wall biosynthesis
MIHGKKLFVVMPAYNAEKTLVGVYNEIPFDYVDELILVDDASSDKTSILSRRLGIRTIIHKTNSGYGANQKTCYKTAINLGADVVIMLHPDYQYSPKLIVAMGSLIAFNQYDVVLGSRILCGSALRGGMPLYKYVANRVLTLIQNLVTGAKLSEYHTGYRGFSKEVLQSLPLSENSNDFIFDNQMLLQILYFGYSIGEISCPARYFEDASSIKFWRALNYGIGVIVTTFQYVLQRFGPGRCKIFSSTGRKLDLSNND